MNEENTAEQSKPEMSQSPVYQEVLKLFSAFPGDAKQLAVCSAHYYEETQKGILPIDNYFYIGILLSSTLRERFNVEKWKRFEEFQNSLAEKLSSTQIAGDSPEAIAQKITAQLFNEYEQIGVKIDKEFSQKKDEIEKILTWFDADDDNPATERRGTVLVNRLEAVERTVIGKLKQSKQDFKNNYLKWHESSLSEALKQGQNLSNAMQFAKQKSHKLSVAYFSNSGIEHDWGIGLLPVRLNVGGQSLLILNAYIKELFAENDVYGYTQPITTTDIDLFRKERAQSAQQAQSPMQLEERKGSRDCFFSESPKANKPNPENAAEEKATSFQGCILL
jgi:hypothetical protein